MSPFTAMSSYASAPCFRLVLVLVVTIAMTLPASAQVFRTESLTSPAPILVEGEVATSDTVLMLSGLAAIERDMMLGMLFLQDGLTSTVGSHFTHPRKETWPLIKDKLAAAGIEDFEGLLISLEGATDQAAVTEAQKAVTVAVLTAESKLKPSDRDKVLAVVAGLRAAHDRFNAAGPTGVVDYQDGWAGLMIERSKVDLLTKSADPVLAKAALDMGTAMDDVILSMPDPAVSAPVDFDPAPVAALMAQIEAMAGAV